MFHNIISVDRTNADLLLTVGGPGAFQGHSTPTARSPSHLMTLLFFSEASPGLPHTPQWSISAVCPGRDVQRVCGVTALSPQKVDCLHVSCE